MSNTTGSKKKNQASNKSRAAKTRSATKKTSSKKGSSRKTQEKKHVSQLCAIVMFSVGLLLTALTFIPGRNIWKWAHDFLFGIFGFPAYFIGPVVIVIAILSSRENPIVSLKSKIIQLLFLFLFICSEIQILNGYPPVGATIFDKIQALYQMGINWIGGGLAGGLIGIPLQSGLGTTAAAVLIGIVLFTLVLIITGTTLFGFFKGLTKPVKKMEESYIQHREQKEEQKQRKFDIDVDLGPSKPPARILSSDKEHFVPEIIEETSDPQEKQSPLSEDQTSPQKKEPYLDDLVKKATNDAEIEKTKKESIPSSKEVLHNPEQPSEMVQYQFPPLSLLKAPVNQGNRDVSGELRANADRLVDTLRSFGVETRITDICRGPSVTRYELQPSAGVKISKITNLADDIALNLAAGGIRIEAPIPNKAAVGIEVPNKKNDIVTLQEIVASNEFRSAKSHLSFALGRDIAGKPTVADIGKMPHVLIAGSTGSGKSVCINSLIISLLYKSSPDDVRLLMIDPKVVELGVYNGIPHLLVPVVTDPRKAAGALGWAVTEMLNRYKMFADNNVRDINGYNRIAKEANDIRPMPRIVIIIDELADLMMAASNEVEDAICRLAQMARAAGMHLVIATQRPSVDVITGLIKANIPSRIAFAVSSQVDSRTILDGSGAEKLLGKGDMLFSPVGSQKPTRVQGCFVSDQEVEQVVSFVKSNDTADYSSDIIEEIERQTVSEKSSPGNGGGFDEQDSMLPKAIECVVESGQASTSFLQRRLKLGYARAARIMDEMEKRGIVGPQEGSKSRQVLISKQQWMEMNLNQDAQ